MLSRKDVSLKLKANMRSGRKRMDKTYTTDLLFQTKVILERHVSKKNNRPIFRRGKRSFIGKGEKLVSAESLLIWSLTSEKNKIPGFIPIEGMLWVKFIFNFGPKQSRSYHLMDLSNLYELPQDCLQSAGIIKNDRLIHSHDGSRKVLSAETSLVIEIYRFKGEGESK
jgi:Holliday junction resolvase RusA-like endonuclease